ncbi:hypothetical protein B0T10DRAFT_500219 [Thelonectria olida]|uniref:ARB-07466-like C-terminal domain-containing protein n=1 Tax=Thelonectria olida TaxID=1576542 RepID=A0A9P8VS26_9HYPO|nr:hypothetical protein B0T10DRAFT_500219 [Thelonectria olida]
MKILTLAQITLSSFLWAFAVSEVNNPCYGKDGIAGVCVSETNCKNSGGISISGACPNDPANIKCCTKPSCPNGAQGNCRWVSDCAGSTVSNKCPGPAQFKCCSSNARGWGGYSTPKIPPVGACKQVAVTGAKKIVAGFPGRIREVQCIGDCPCTSTPKSDHCCGKATDIMCSDRVTYGTISGRDIAEWVMNHSQELNLKYVIYGQKIWNPSMDKRIPWTQWRNMDNSGDITVNHWDHVHVSYK